MFISVFHDFDHGKKKKKRKGKKSHVLSFPALMLSVFHIRLWHVAIFSTIHVCVELD